MSTKPTVRQLREERGWNIRQLEAKSGVDKSILSRMENVWQQPNANQKKGIARAFGVNISDIRFPVCTLPEPREAHGA